MRTIDGKVYDTRDVVKLLATDQKYAALAEAVLDAEVIDGGPGMPIKLAMVASKHWRRIKALAQPDQPAGEWITINEDGSNLPEHVEGAEWFVQDGTGRAGWTSHGPARWRAKMYRPDRTAVAYWSLLHQPVQVVRPDIPEYTAR